MQRDHAALLDLCAQRLAADGTIFFSNNARRFELDPLLAQRLDVREITASTIPPDFARTPRIHRCYEIRHRRPVS